MGNRNCEKGKRIKFVILQENINELLDLPVHKAQLLFKPCHRTTSIIHKEINADVLKTRIQRGGSIKTTKEDDI